MTRYPTGFKGFYFRSRVRFNPNRMPEYGQWEAHVELSNQAMPGRPLMHGTVGGKTHKEVRENVRVMRRAFWRFVRSFYNDRRKSE